MTSPGERRDVRGPAPAPGAAAACVLCAGQERRTLADDVGDYEYGAPGTWRWLICDGCGLVWLDPPPSDELLALAYPPTYHGYVEPAAGVSRWLIGRARGNVARRLAALLPPGGTILDVGCSTGALLQSVGRLGAYRLVGVEYDAAAAAIARRRGIDVHQGELLDAPLAPASVDLVVMQHVLEHVRDPIATLRGLAAVLRPGGRIIGELPNLASWDAALFGRLWGGGHAPRHLWHFTPATLSRALTATGFAPVRIRPALHTGHWALSIQNWLRGGRRDTQGLRSGRTWYFPLLLLMTIPVNAIQLVLRRTGVMRFEAGRL